ncbi:hypothetical protein GOP47_0018224, partial [Adiantum capillus-veneris]
SIYDWLVRRYAFVKEASASSVQQLASCASRRPVFQNPTSKQPLAIPSVSLSSAIAPLQPASPAHPLKVLSQALPISSAPVCRFPSRPFRKPELRPLNFLLGFLS